VTEDELAAAGRLLRADGQMGAVLHAPGDRIELRDEQVNVPARSGRPLPPGSVTDDDRRMVREAELRHHDPDGGVPVAGLEALIGTGGDDDVAGRVRRAVGDGVVVHVGNVQGRAAMHAHGVVTRPLGQVTPGAGA
jgi:hypothetical protein